MVDIVVAGGACVLKFLNVEPVRDRDIVRIEIRRGSLDIKDALMTTNAVWIDLVKFG